MADVIDPEVSAYAEAHTTPVADFMTRLAQETHATLRFPQMLTGVVEGRFLEMLVFATGARRVLELGTYSGYSALSMAHALPPDGRIISCEYSDEHADFAQRHIDASPYADRIEIRRGPAIDTIATLDGPFDLVFVDADKTSYAAYVEACLPLLAERGLMVIDNTLWSREVLTREPGESDNTRALRELNDALVADPRVVCVQLPIRDGVTLVRRADR
jgi:caffeoyl-CoA O-methyltransferase